MSGNLRFGRILFCLLSGLVLGASFPAHVCAADMPHAAGSPLAGITFDDRPLLLPVQRNFQMAMLTASSELGRSCGKMEAYGWRMNSDEQQRVNQIFNNTVDRLRAQGFMVESKSPASVSRDVTMFTADRPDKHLIFMWSAGEIGLVMVLCETSAPLSATPSAAVPPSAMAPLPSRDFRVGAQAGSNALIAPLPLTRTGRKSVENFSPLGDWAGTYTCRQGTTGGTLQITSLRGDQFEGTFRFYPTPKNPYVPSGRYTVFGEYDRDSYRILINPGKWLERPKDFYNTIMIGSFDPVAGTFSGYFQGINGCTSFEARYSSASNLIDDETIAKAAKPAKKAVKKKTRKPAAKKAAVKSGDSETKTTEPKRESAAEPKKESAKPTDTIPLPPKPELAIPESPSGIELGGQASPPSAGKDSKSK